MTSFYSLSKTTCDHPDLIHNATRPREAAQVKRPEPCPRRTCMFSAAPRCVLPAPRPIASPKADMRIPLWKVCRWKGSLAGSELAGDRQWLARAHIGGLERSAASIVRESSFWGCFRCRDWVRFLGSWKAIDIHPNPSRRTRAENRCESYDTWEQTWLTVKDDWLDAAFPSHKRTNQSPLLVKR